MVCASAGDDPKDLNHTLLRTMSNALFNELDPVTIDSIRFIIKDIKEADNPELGEKNAQEKWAGTEALEIYNEYKDQELKIIPTTDYSFAELKFLHVETALNHHHNDTTLNGMGLVMIEDGDLGFGNYEDNHIYVSSQTTRTNYHGNFRGSSLTIQAFRGNDAIFGNDQDSYIFGATQAFLEGGSYTHDSDHDYIKAGGGSDAAYGAGGNDFIEGNEGNDFLYGGQGWDILMGGQNDDKLFGGKGSDILVAGIGDDILTGGEGEDVFVFGGNPLMHFHQNTIKDFGNGWDTIVFPDTFENLDLHVREDLDQGKIFVRSGVTNIDILEVRGTMGEVGISSRQLFSFGGNEPGLDRIFNYTETHFAEIAVNGFASGCSRGIWC